MGMLLISYYRTRIGSDRKKILPFKNNINKTIRRRDKINILIFNIGIKDSSKNQKINFAKEIKHSKLIRHSNI